MSFRKFDSTVRRGAAAEGGERYDADRRFKRGGVQPPLRHRYFATELFVTQARALDTSGTLRKLPEHECARCRGKA